MACCHQTKNITWIIVDRSSYDGIIRGRVNPFRANFFIGNKNIYIHFYVIPPYHLKLGICPSHDQHPVPMKTQCTNYAVSNKANLRDLIAATGLVILLKFDPNHRFFVPCDLEIWWMALENNRAPLLYYIKLCASFQIHRWIQIGITVRKR